MNRKIIKNTIFYYDPILKETAKTHRKNPTPSESIFWKLVRNKQINGYRFQRQKPLGKFILDFYCSKLLLAVEIDGNIHDTNKEKDNERTAYLNEVNITVIRFSNVEVLQTIDLVKSTLMTTVKQREKKLNIKPPRSPLTGGGKKVILAIPLSRGTEGV